MNDTISRSAAIDAINKALDRETLLNSFVRKVAVDAVKVLPTAQPEIIHCKDCKYNSNPPECGNAVCVLFYGMTDQMGFCHHGERRERE